MRRNLFNFLIISLLVLLQTACQTQNIKNTANYDKRVIKATYQKDTLPTQLTQALDDALQNTGVFQKTEADSNNAYRLEATITDYQQPTPPENEPSSQVMGIDKQYQKLFSPQATNRLVLNIRLIDEHNGNTVEEKRFSAFSKINESSSSNNAFQGMMNNTMQKIADWSKNIVIKRHEVCCGKAKYNYSIGLQATIPLD